MSTESLGLQQGLRQNRIKFSVFRVLAEANSPLGVNELALLADVHYHSLATRLPKLHRWHYLKRHIGYNYQGRPCFIYSLTTKGHQWLEKHCNDYPEDTRPCIKLRDGIRPPTFEEYLMAKEAGKGILRGFENIASGIGDTIHWIGDIIAEKGGRPVPGMIKPAWQKNLDEKIGNKVADWGKTASRFWRQESLKGMEAPDVQVFQGSLPFPLRSLLSRLR